jgi:NTP pyrophosphatase (non-canonical NTP hydrolase)
MNLQAEATQWLERRNKNMTFAEYEETVKKTAIYPSSHKILYPALGLAGEAGEVANKVKKLIRDGFDKQPKDWRERLASEIGDVLWYCVALSNDLNVPISTVAKGNMDKLLSRFERGTLGGSGDKR